ncbi:hypothetical protein [Streptomyces sp. NE5-10]|uniref:hypothetical protein n=1 Tax=Streptomyces sp. NE5-10 TaxID=2759674 RepID=UPI0019033356|nr:hypothetical protein [Streptomyces sp. NE5-10]
MSLDVAGGRRVFGIDGFRPTRQDRHTGTLIEVGGAHARSWTPSEWTARAG